MQLCCSYRAGQKHHPGTDNIETKAGIDSIGTEARNTASGRLETFRGQDRLSHIMLSSVITTAILMGECPTTMTAVKAVISSDIHLIRQTHGIAGTIIVDEIETMDVADTIIVEKIEVMDEKENIPMMGTAMDTTRGDRPEYLQRLRESIVLTVPVTLSITMIIKKVFIITGGQINGSLAFEYSGREPGRCSVDVFIDQPEPVVQC